MKRGRPPKNKSMDTKHILTDTGQKLPTMHEGDAVSLTLEIQRVSNGYIITNKEPDTKAGVMVFNGQEAHRMLVGHVLNLALPDMKEGEVVVFSSQLTYTKKLEDADKH